MIMLRRMRWTGYVARMGRRGMHIILVRKPEGKRPRHKWEDNIKMDLGGIGCREHGNEPWVP
jgi:hypothetical protein